MTDSFHILNIMFSISYYSFTISLLFQYLQKRNTERRTNSLRSLILQYIIRCIFQRDILQSNLPKSSQQGQKSAWKFTSALKLKDGAGSSLHR